MWEWEGRGGTACTAARLHYRFSFFSHTKTRIAQKIKPRQPTSAEPLTSEGWEGGVRGGEVGGKEGGGRTEGRAEGCKKRGCRRKRPSVPRRNSPSLRVVFFLTSRLTSTQPSADVCERQSSRSACRAVRDSVIAAEQQRRRFDSRECL